MSIVPTTTTTTGGQINLSSINQLSAANQRQNKRLYAMHQSKVRRMMVRQMAGEARWD